MGSETRWTAAASSAGESSSLPARRTRLSSASFAACRGSTPHERGSAGHQHDPRLVHGRHPAGQLRAPGHPDGDRAGGLHPVAALPALRPRRSDLAQPRPLRALGGSRVGAPLVAAPSDAGPSRRSRLRAARPAGRDDGGPADVPPTRLPLPGPPGVPLDERRRDDDGTARARCRDIGRDRRRREMAGDSLQHRRRHAVRLQRLCPCR